MKKVTAGRDILGDIAPKFAELNDDVLFGQVWSRDENLSLKERSMITVTALMSSGILDSSLKGHILRAKENGVSKEEIVEILTHAAFYAGWPKAWAAFYMVKEIYGNVNDQNKVENEQRSKDLGNDIFGLGDKNDAFSKYFIGQSYLKKLVEKPFGIANVTFEPSCRNNWHIHHGGGQILLVTSGYGWYQEDGKKAQFLKPGDVVNISPEVKHWHGAAKDSWFSHIAIEIPSDNSSNEWLEAVEDEEYNKLYKK